MTQRNTSAGGRSVDDRGAWPPGNVELGSDVRIDPGAVVGYVYDEGAGPTVIGSGSRVRSGSVIYADVELGRNCATGHDALIRERTVVGEDSLVGTKSVLDGGVEVGSDVSIQTGAYVPPGTVLGDRVFLGPHAVLTNDPTPLRAEVELDGPTLAADVSVGANATVLPGVTVGRRSFVAAGAVVTRDVPPRTLAVGVPAEHRPLPDRLDRRNDAS